MQIEHVDGSTVIISYNNFYVRIDGWAGVWLVYCGRKYEQEIAEFPTLQEALTYVFQHRERLFIRL